MQVRPCTCKATKCLKLYCQCFHAGVYCAEGVCKCSDCSNTPRSQDAVIEARLMISIRNPQAFTKSAAGGEPSNRRGCNCRRSRCLKKYCDCFGSGTHCSPETCRCTDCLNYVGSVHAVSALQGRSSDVPSSGLNPQETASNDSNIAEDQPAVTQPQNVMLYGREAHQPPTTLDSLRWLGMPSHRPSSALPDTATSGVAPAGGVASTPASNLQIAVPNDARNPAIHEGYKNNDSSARQFVVSNAAHVGDTAHKSGLSMAVQRSGVGSATNEHNFATMQSISNAVGMAKQGSAESQTIPSQLRMSKVDSAAITHSAYGESSLPLPTEISGQLPVEATGLAPMSSISTGQVRQVPGLFRRHSEPCLKQLQSIALMLQQPSSPASVLKLLPLQAAGQQPLPPVQVPIPPIDTAGSVMSDSQELTAKQSHNVSLPDQPALSLSTLQQSQQLQHHNIPQLPPSVQQQEQQALQQEADQTHQARMLSTTQESTQPQLQPLLPPQQMLAALPGTTQKHVQDMDVLNLPRMPLPATTARDSRTASTNAIQEAIVQPQSPQQQQQLTDVSNKPSTPCNIPIPSNLDSTQRNKILSFMNSPDCFLMLHNIIQSSQGTELQSALTGMLSLLHACTSDVTHLTPQRAWGEDHADDVQYAASVAATEQLPARYRTLALQLIPCIVCTSTHQQPHELLGSGSVIQAITTAWSTETFPPIKVAGLCVAALMPQPAFDSIKDRFATAAQCLSQLDWSPVIAYCQQSENTKSPHTASSWQELASIAPSIALLQLPAATVNHSARDIITSAGLGSYLGLVSSDVVVRAVKRARQEDNAQLSEVQQHEGIDQANDENPHSPQAGHGHAVCVVQIPQKQSETFKVAARSQEGDQLQQLQTPSGTANLPEEQRLGDRSTSESGLLIKQASTIQASLHAAPSPLHAPGLHLTPHTAEVATEAIVKPSPRLIETAIQLPGSEPAKSPDSEQGRVFAGNNAGVAQSPNNKPNSPAYRQTSHQQPLPDEKLAGIHGSGENPSQVRPCTQAAVSNLVVSLQEPNTRIGTCIELRGTANQSNMPQAGVGSVKTDPHHTVGVGSMLSESAPQHGTTLGTSMPMIANPNHASQAGLPTTAFARFVCANQLSSPPQQLQLIGEDNIHAKQLHQSTDPRLQGIGENQQTPNPLRPHLLPGGYSNLQPHSAVDLSSYFVFGSPIPARQESTLPVIEVPPPHHEVTNRIRAMQHDLNTPWAPQPATRVSAPGIYATQLQQPTLGILGRVGSMPTHSSSSTMSAFMSSAGGAAAQAAVFAAGLPVVGGFGTIWHTGSGSYSGASVPVHETGPAGPFLSTYNSSTSSVVAYTMAMPTDHQQACHISATMPSALKTSVHASPVVAAATPVSQPAKFITSPSPLTAMLPTILEKRPVTQLTPMTEAPKTGQIATLAKESNVSGPFLPIQTQYPTITTGALPGDVTPKQASQVPLTLSPPVSMPTVMLSKVTQPGNQITTPWQQPVAVGKPDSSNNNITVAGYTHAAAMPQAATLYMLGPDGQLWQLPNTTAIQPMPSVSVAPLTVWPSFQSSGFHVDSRDQSTGLAIQPLNTIIPQAPTYTANEKHLTTATVNFQQPGISHSNQVVVAERVMQQAAVGSDAGNMHTAQRYPGQKTARETGAETDLMHSPAKRQRANNSAPTRNAH